MNAGRKRCAEPGLKLLAPGVTRLGACQKRVQAARHAYCLTPSSTPKFDRKKRSRRI